MKKWMSLLLLTAFGSSVMAAECEVVALYFRWVHLSLSPLPFASLLFSAVCKASSDNHFAFLHFFSLGMV